MPVLCTFCVRKKSGPYAYLFCTFLYEKIRCLCLCYVRFVYEKNPALVSPVNVIFLHVLHYLKRPSDRVCFVYEKNPAIMPICFVRFCTKKSGAYACVTYVLCTKKIRPLCLSVLYVLVRKKPNLKPICSVRL